MTDRTHDRRLTVVRAALRHWDPRGLIGDQLHGTGDRDHHYDGYALGLLRDLEHGCDADRVAHHLSRIRSASMGVGTAGSTEKEKELAAKLIDWRDSGYPDGQDFGFTRSPF